MSLLHHYLIICSYISQLKNLTDGLHFFLTIVCLWLLHRPLRCLLLVYHLIAEKMSVVFLWGLLLVFLIHYNVSKWERIHTSVLDFSSPLKMNISLTHFKILNHFSHHILSLPHSVCSLLPDLTEHWNHFKSISHFLASRIRQTISFETSNHMITVLTRSSGLRILGRKSVTWVRTLTWRCLFFS